MPSSMYTVYCRVAAETISVPSHKYMEVDLRDPYTEVLLMLHGMETLPI